MSLTPSNMLELGTKAPEFQLVDTVTNQLCSYHDIKGERGTVVMFICNHCPFVVHVIDEIVHLYHLHKVQQSSRLYLLGFL